MIPRGNAGRREMWDLIWTSTWFLRGRKSIVMGHSQSGIRNEPYMYIILASLSLYRQIDSGYNAARWTQTPTQTTQLPTTTMTTVDCSRRRISYVCIKTQSETYLKSYVLAICYAQTKKDNPPARRESSLCEYEGSRGERYHGPRSVFTSGLGPCTSTLRLPKIHDADSDTLLSDREDNDRSRYTTPRLCSL